MITLKNVTPTARKEHRCDFCGGVIAIGDKYERQTNIYDNQIYDWICHSECQAVAHKLDMYNRCDDEGLDCDSFRECINEYVYEHHYDSDLDDIAKGWQLPFPEIVKKIFEELIKR